MPATNPAAAVLAEIKRIAAGGIFLLSDHAEERMVERKVTRLDIRAAIAAATVAEWQESGTWAIRGGVDRQGMALTVVVVLVRGMMVVTVF